MPKFVYFILFLILAFVAFKFLVTKNGATKGEIAPEIEAELIDGSSFKLSELKGSYVLIDFWGSWCPPCRRENPSLVALHHQFNGKTFEDANGFEVVTIALEKNNRTWKAAAQKDGFDWKYQIVQEAKFVALSPLARLYGVSDLPSKFLINPKGELVGKTDFQSVEELLSSKLKKE